MDDRVVPLKNTLIASEEIAGAERKALLMLVVEPERSLNGTAHGC